MALIECPECGQNVSDRADACPNCGYPVGTMITSLDKGTQPFVVCDG